MSEDVITSLYPPPPPYYKYFTSENIAKFKEGSNSQEKTPVSGELRLQIPPEIPSSDQYRGYGSVWSLENKLPSLKDSGWQQLYREEDETITSKAKIEELHKLLDSLLLNFLELVASVSVEPAKFYVKIEHLKLILINMNHLLNTYRPHQTRESLIILLRSQIDAKKAEIAQINSVTNEVKGTITRLVQRERSPAPSVEPEALNDEDADSSLEKERILEMMKQIIAAK